MASYDVARLEEFLAPSRIAVVATVGRTGMPQLTPNWYHFANGRLNISTTKERVKYQNLSRNPSLTVCIYSDPMARDYVVLSGQAQVTDGDSIWPETQAIVERYTEAGVVEERMSQLKQQDRVLITLEPERVVFRM